LRILFLTQIIPYPPDAGPKVKTWHVLRYLVEQGHEVILASFVRPEEQSHIPHLERLCAQVHTVPITRSRLQDIGYWLRSHLTGRPFLIERDDLGGMRALVDRLLDEGDIDAIHADQLTMTLFALDPNRFEPDRGGKDNGSTPQRVFDAHNAVWTIVERMGKTAPWYLKPVLRLETARVKRYEGRVVREFDHTLAVAEPDRIALLEALADFDPHVRPEDFHISVIPIAVDSKALAPVYQAPGHDHIVTLGTLHYPPNADGIRWFAQEVFPRIKEQVPAGSLTIIGKNPPPDFLQLARENPDSVEVTGYVPDLVPYLQRSDVMVVPVRAGGGMRVRILEAFSRAMPVVTTTVGLEGIDARPGHDVLVEDTPERFARAAVRLMKDREFARRMGEKGRLLAERRYDWQVVLEKMNALYE
jgi:glycosyltransferase involved in cell wall biosynthesis